MCVLPILEWRHRKAREVFKRFPFFLIRVYEDSQCFNAIIFRKKKKEKKSAGKRCILPGLEL